MSVILEYQDLRVRVPTNDAALGDYSGRLVKWIDPAGNEGELSASVDLETFLAVDMDKTQLIRGIWRFGGEAVDLGNKLRKAHWYKLRVWGEGELGWQ